MCFSSRARRPPADGRETEHCQRLDPMSKQPRRIAWWQKLALRLASMAPAAWLLRRTAHHADRLPLEVSGGHHTLTTLLTGLPVATLTTTGARSGKRRTVPVVIIPRGEQVALIASNFGHSRHPAWYHNLLAQGEATLTVNGQTERYQAREAWRRAPGGLAAGSGPLPGLRSLSPACCRTTNSYHDPRTAAQCLGEVPRAARLAEPGRPDASRPSEMARGIIE